MQSARSEPIPAPEVSRAQIDSCSIEIGIQRYLLWLIVLPTAMVIVPTALIALCAFALGGVIAQTSGHLSTIGVWVQDQWWGLVFVSGAAVLSTLAIELIQAPRTPSPNAERRLRTPSGNAGETLRRVVAELWDGLPRSTGSPPEIRWFANFNVMASIAQSRVMREIQVSAALWERAIIRDPIALGILAHEMAHLAFHDRLRMRPIEAIVRTARQVRALVVWTVLATAVILTLWTIGTGMAGTGWPVIARRAAAVLFFVPLFLSIPTLTDATVRRQASLITALMEIRADVCAGLWTDGVAGFARALTNDPHVLASSRADIRHSLLSTNLTHVSTFERIALLSDPQRLVTPKLRYLALSLALTFLLPINPITPLLAGGAWDHILVTGVVVAIHVATVAMVTAGALALQTPLGWQNAAMLAVFSCVASVLPRVNFYAVGYLLTDFGSRIGKRGGIGSDPETWASVTSDIGSTIRELGQKLWAAAGGTWVVMAIICSSVALRALSIVAQHARSKWPNPWRAWFFVAPSIAAGLLAVASSYDPWRDAFFHLPLLGLSAPWDALTRHVVWIRLSAPELVALAVFVIQVAGCHAVLVLQRTRKH